MDIVIFLRIRWAISLHPLHERVVWHPYWQISQRALDIITFAGKLMCDPLWPQHQEFVLGVIISANKTPSCCQQGSACHLAPLHVTNGVDVNCPLYQLKRVMATLPSNGRYAASEFSFA